MSEIRPIGGPHNICTFVHCFRRTVVVYFFNWNMFLSWPARLHVVPSRRVDTLLSMCITARINFFPIAIIRFFFFFMGTWKLRRTLICNIIVVLPSIIRTQFRVDLTCTLTIYRLLFSLLIPKAYYIPNNYQGIL